LLDNNALTNLKDKKGRTALHFAVNNGDIEMAKLLVSTMEGIDILINNQHTALTFALKNNNIDMVNCLLTCGVEVNRPNAQGTTPIMMTGDL